MHGFLHLGPNHQFEMVIISFGAGFNLESTDPVYLAAMRNISDYAAAKGIEMGGYDLLAHTRGRGGNASAECIGPDGRPDGSTCLASQGSDDVFMHINNFVDKTNWSSIETDGPFEGTQHNTQCLTGSIRRYEAQHTMPHWVHSKVRSTTHNVSLPAPLTYELPPLLLLASFAAACILCCCLHPVYLLI
jgi:hypothetical protein